jgi:four helix bundle protein
LRQLSHENLDVYQRSIEFLALSTKLLASIPKGNQIIVDQLKRAAISTVLNIAEGAGHPYEAKRRNHYSIARGSALECGAALDTCIVLKVGKQELIPDGKELLVAIVSMLSKMCRVTQKST